MNKKKLFIVFAFLAIVTIAIWGVINQRRDSNPLPKVRIGYLAIAGSLPLFVAEEQGFFKEENVVVELLRFNSSNEIAIAAATGKIDLIGIGATNAVLDASKTANVIFKAFMLNGYTKSHDGEQATDYLLARKGVNIDNLEGKKIAFFPGSISKVFANLIFPKYGMDMADIEYIEMAPPNWIPSFESGAIDAVTAIEPFAQMLRDKGLVDVLIDGYYAEVMPDVPLSAVWFIDGKLSEKVEISIFNSFRKSIAFIQEDRGRALKSFSKYTKMNPNIYMRIGLNNWRMIDERGAVESLKDFIKILVQDNGIKGVPESYIWNKPE